MVDVEAPVGPADVVPVRRAAGAADALGGPAVVRAVAHLAAVAEQVKARIFGRKERRIG